VPWPEGADGVEARYCVAAVVGAEGSLGGFTLLNDWRASGLEPPKDRDFALSLGPWIVTHELFDGGGFPWREALAHAAERTHLRPGDVLAAPPFDTVRVERGGETSSTHDALGVLRSVIA
jgi:hypothetical protein